MAHVDTLSASPLMRKACRRLQIASRDTIAAAPYSAEFGWIGRYQASCSLVASRRPSRLQ